MNAYITPDGQRSLNPYSAVQDKMNAYITPDDQRSLNQYYAVQFK